MATSNVQLGVGEGGVGYARHVCRQSQLGLGWALTNIAAVAVPQAATRARLMNP